LRTVDVARRVGCSVQHLRDLEREGVLPAAERTSSGYRSWGQVHVLAAIAYRELAQGVGPARAGELLRALHAQPLTVFLAGLDDAHADLARQRRGLRLAREAVAAIAAEPLTAPEPSDSMTITELTEALGLTPATLRHWEAQGLLAPARAGHGRVRTYTPAQVRDARVVHQLRTAGYGIPQLREVLHLLSSTRRADDALDAGLGARDRQLTQRSHGLLRAAAAVHALTALHRAAEDTGPEAGPS
jgi:DNA-binding transcriptional MerR regulator